VPLGVEREKPDAAPGGGLEEVVVVFEAHDRPVEGGVSGKSGGTIGGLRMRGVQVARQVEALRPPPDGQPERVERAGQQRQVDPEPRSRAYDRIVGQ
jgi:hypothetical protein